MAALVASELEGLFQLTGAIKREPDLDARPGVRERSAAIPDSGLVDVRPWGRGVVVVPFEPRRCRSPGSPCSGRNRGTGVRCESSGG